MENAHEQSKAKESKGKQAKQQALTRTHTRSHRKQAENVTLYKKVCVYLPDWRQATNGQRNRHPLQVQNGSAERGSELLSSVSSDRQRKDTDGRHRKRPTN